MANFVTYENATEILEKVSEKFNRLGGAFVPKGSKTFSAIPATVTAGIIGYVYNISEDFTTDARFVEGAGKKYPAGTNVVAVDNGTVTYTEVTPEGTENPQEEGWYEESGGEYILTTDTSITSSKTYYEQNVTHDYKYDVLGNFIDTDAIDDRIDGAQSMTAPAFDTSVSYAEGDIVTYEDELYKCTTAHTAGAWNAEDFTKTNAAELIAEAEPDSLTSEQVNALLALLD